MKPKILVILGQTATGKSALAVELAKKYNGEVISADSRQVYTGLNIGTGKVTKIEMRGVPHHMLDVVSPKKVFSVAEWKEQTDKIILEIISRGKLPIICGGTGFYIKSIVENIVLPEVPPNPILRKKLEKKTVDQLFEMLKKLDPRRTETMTQEQGHKNPVRLVRAIEIATALGKVPSLNTEKSPYDFLQIGLELSDKKLQEKIKTRLHERMKKGMVAEVRKLHISGIPWKRLNALGLEYRYVAEFLQEKQPLKASSSRMTANKKEMLEKLETEIWQYAKRQKTWFQKDKNIQWFEPKKRKTIHTLVKKFLD